VARRQIRGRRCGIRLDRDRLGFAHHAVDQVDRSHSKQNRDFLVMDHLVFIGFDWASV